jgi:hypothetical protein
VIGLWITGLVTVQPMLVRWGWGSGVHFKGDRCTLFGTFVHNAAHIVFVWLELQTCEKFFRKSLARGA